MHPIWFILGISGAGKSYFSELAAQKLSWFHYEIDLAPHDGITHWGFRTEWDIFLQNNQIEPLVQSISARSCKDNCAGSILSFPSNLIACLSEQQVARALQSVKLIVLSGPENLCRNAFLQREQESGRRLNEEHWTANNKNLYPFLQYSWIAPHVFDTFLPDGSRKPFEPSRVGS